MLRAVSLDATSRLVKLIRRTLRYALNFRASPPFSRPILSSHVELCEQTYISIFKKEVWEFVLREADPALRWAGEKGFPGPTKSYETISLLPAPEVPLPKPRERAASARWQTVPSAAGLR